MRATDMAVAKGRRRSFFMISIPVISLPRLCFLPSRYLCPPGEDHGGEGQGPHRHSVFRAQGQECRHRPGIQSGMAGLYALVLTCTSSFLHRLLLAVTPVPALCLT